MNPVIAEVTRGSAVESIHRGAWAVVDAYGTVVESAGDIETPKFARSSLKLMQALPLVESGAAAAYHYTPQHLSLACASHSGAPEHVAACREMLTNAELTAEDLRCGAHVPLFRIADTLAHAHAKTEIDRTSNQCSGKHAGFLAVARHEGHSTHDYLAMDHPVQAEIRSLIEGLSGHGFHPHDCNCDGCSAPTYALPIKAFAYAFAKLRTGVDVGAVRAKSAAALFEACTEFPWFMAGEGRFDTVLMRTADGRLFAKTGAEGVYIAALRDEGLGIAIKCDDGNGRAAEVTVARLAGKHMNHDATKALARRDIADFNGNVVGELKAV